jgi:6-phosphogluconolactonase
LTALNQQPSVGPGPAHLVVDKAGRNVLVANYGGGSVAVVPIGPDGALKPPSAFIQHSGSSVNPERQKGPHAHSINLDPANRFAYAADLGLDKVLVYRFDADNGSLVPNDPPFAQVAAGAGPRHFAIHPNGFAYVINEMNMTVTAFRRDVERGFVDGVADDLDAATRPEAWRRLQHRGRAGASVWTISSTGPIAGTTASWSSQSTRTPDG